MTFTEIRKKKYFTQETLATKMGVSQSTVAMWETGKSIPNMKNLMKLSNILSVNLTVLCGAFEKNKVQLSK